MRTGKRNKIGIPVDPRHGCIRVHTTERTAQRTGTAADLQDPPRTVQGKLWQILCVVPDVKPQQP